jgi:hypothetical protein
MLVVSPPRSQTAALACSWATMALAAGKPDEMAVAASHAALQVSRAFRHIGQEAIQLHGSVGMAAEYSIGRYTSRLTALDHLLGDGSVHLTALAADTSDHEELDPLGAQVAFSRDRAAGDRGTPSQRGRERWPVRGAARWAGNGRCGPRRPAAAPPCRGCW